MTTLLNDPVPDVSPPSAPAEAERGTARGQADTLAIAWIHGVFHLATYRRANLVATWTTAEHVTDIASFGNALDAALAATRFRATETILLLAHPRFAHQIENCPSFSDHAIRTYLRGRVERFERENGPVLSVAQPAARIRNEVQSLLHLLPRDFYLELNQAFLARHLDLTRIIPTAVPLQLEMAGLPGDQRENLLMAVRMGDSTAVVACGTGGEILLSRTTLSSWSDDPSRVAVEINRCLLYAKQQHGVTIQKIQLSGAGAERVRAEVGSHCGGDCTVTVQDGDPTRWLSLIARLTPRHPVNLVAGYLRTKRRNHFLRRVILATCWLLLAVLLFDSWAREQIWHGERDRLNALSADEYTLQEDYDHLVERNALADRNRAFIKQVVDDRLPPVPDRFLKYVASILPRDVRLVQFSVNWNEETGEWKFRIDGMLEADAETARLTVNSIRRELSQSPLKVRFIESVRPEMELNLSTESTAQPFTLEGGLF
ncbi:MAG: hypothetical protein R3F07_10285 [Opitutaceae bacterium]